MERHRRRGWLLIGVSILIGAAAMTVVLEHGSPTGQGQDNTPTFAGGEPVNSQLQAVYATAPLGPVDERWDWPQFGGDAAHSFTSMRAAPLLRGRIAWFASLGGPSPFSPVVVSKIVYAGGTDGFLRAIDRQTGRLLWRVGLGDSLSDASPAVGNGRVYANGYGTLTLAFDARTGRPVWQADNRHLPTAPPTYYRGLVLVASDGNFLSCYDARTGKLYWRFQSEDVLADFWPTRGAAAAAGRLAYVALGASSEFMAIDLTTGIKRWEFAIGERLSGAPVLSDGAVYVATASGRVLCLDAANGALRWQISLPQGVGQGTQASPAVSSGRLFLGTNNGMLFALSARTGRPLWKAMLGGHPLLSTPDVDGTALYVPGGDGVLYCLDAATGHRHWALRLGEMRGSGALTDGTLFVSSVGDGGLYAIR